MNFFRPLIVLAILLWSQSANTVGFELLCQACKCNNRTTWGELVDDIQECAEHCHEDDHSFFEYAIGTNYCWCCGSDTYQFRMNKATYRILPPTSTTVNPSSGSSEFPPPAPHENPSQLPSIGPICWSQTSGGNDVLECMDAYRCNGRWQGWDCCAPHGGRAKCPDNMPVMCNDRSCPGNAHCCQTDCVGFGGRRPCQTSSPSFHPTTSPSIGPTFCPSMHPTSSPSIGPTFSPSVNPSTLPSFNPTSICEVVYQGGCQEYLVDKALTPYMDRRYSKRECHDLCRADAECGGFYLTISDGACLPVKPGCTQSENSDVNYYDMSTCIYGTETCVLDSGMQALPDMSVTSYGRNNPIETMWSYTTIAGGIFNWIVNGNGHDQNFGTQDSTLELMIQGERISISMILHRGSTFQPFETFSGSAEVNASDTIVLRTRGCWGCHVYTQDVVLSWTIRGNCSETSPIFSPTKCPTIDPSQNPNAIPVYKPTTQPSFSLNPVIPEYETIDGFCWDDAYGTNEQLPCVDRANNIDLCAIACTKIPGCQGFDFGENDRDGIWCCLKRTCYGESGQGGPGHRLVRTLYPTSAIPVYNPTSNPTYSPDHDRRINPTLLPVFSLLKFRIPSTQPTVHKISPTYECDWVTNNYNMHGKREVGYAESPEECIGMVLQMCPNATIANLPVTGFGDCSCQYGYDMREYPSASYKNCLLSSISQTGFPSSYPSESSKHENDESGSNKSTRLAVLYLVLFLVLFFIFLALCAFYCYIRKKEKDLVKHHEAELAALGKYKRPKFSRTNSKTTYIQFYPLRTTIDSIGPAGGSTLDFTKEETSGHVALENFWQDSEHTIEGSLGSCEVEELFGDISLPTDLPSKESVYLRDDEKMLSEVSMSPPQRKLGFTQSSENDYINNSFTMENLSRGMKTTNAMRDSQFSVFSEFATRRQKPLNKNVAKSRRLWIDEIDFYESPKVLGKGHFGNVMLATYKGSAVALKAVEWQSYLREGELFFNVSNHPNICRFYGLYQKGDANYLVMDYWKDGSLLDAIERNDLSLGDKMNIFHQLSCGLFHLHDRDVIHADVAARNCLVDLRIMKVCLTDFGLSCKSPARNQLNTMAPRWASPELLSTRIPSKSSDVWAFGVTCCEVVTESKPYDHLPSIEFIRNMKSGNLFHPNIEETWPDPLRNVLEQIFVFAPRISMKDIERKLRCMKRM